MSDKQKILGMSADEIISKLLSGTLQKWQLDHLNKIVEMDGEPCKGYTLREMLGLNSEEQKKICPILLAGNNHSEPVCRKNECHWWQKYNDERQCAMALIPVMLFQVAVGIGKMKEV